MVRASLIKHEIGLAELKIKQKIIEKGFQNQKE